MSIFDRNSETMPRATLEQLQLERLQALLARLKRNVRRYRERIADLRLESLADLAKFPFTTPEDVADSFPYGLFSFPLREIIRLHSIMGPKGSTLVVGHTRNDLVHWGRLAARQFAASGMTPNDVVQVALSGGLYRGALGYALGAEQIEASVIEEEPHCIEAQLNLLENYRPTVLVTTPTNALALMNAMAHHRKDPQSFHLRTVFLSRPVAGELWNEIRAGLQVNVSCNFGIDEILDPGFSVQCEAGRFHVNEDQFLVEVEDGELIVTTLAREAMPLLRYRTRLACETPREKCSCGRTGTVIMPKGRLDNRFRVGETPLYEEQIAQVLRSHLKEEHPYNHTVAGDKLVVSIQMTPAIFSDMIWQLEDFRRRMVTDFLDRLGVVAEVRFVY